MVGVRSIASSCRPSVGLVIRVSPKFWVGLFKLLKVRAYINRTRIDTEQSDAQKVQSRVRVDCSTQIILYLPDNSINKMNNSIYHSTSISVCSSFSNAQAKEP
jgi:hypothetical protein